MIIGKIGADPSKDSLIYAHYDGTTSEFDLTQWGEHRHLGANNYRRVMYGRGAADNKGPLMAHLNAIEFWLKKNMGSAC